MSEDEHQRVLRLGYHAVWSEHEERAEQTLYFVKGRDVEAGRWNVVRHTDRALLPFVKVGATSRPLSLRDRAAFRKIVELVELDDLHTALGDVQGDLEAAASVVGAAEQLRQAIVLTANDVEELLGLTDEPEDAIHLLPGGGSIASLLNSLEPQLDTRDGTLPLARTGSTRSALLSLGEALALVSESNAIVVADDFGDKLDGGAAAHLLARLQARAHQAWITTRRPDVAESFDPDHVIRLAPEADGDRRAGQLPSQSTLPRAMRTTIKHLGPQLLRAAAGQCAVIVEGPDDVNSITSLSRRMTALDGIGLPAVRAVVVHPGLMQESGGHHATGRLARALNLLGVRSVIVLDGDTDQGDVDAAVEAASAVVRLPDGFAIERVLLHGLDLDVVEEALEALVEAFGLDVEVDPADLDLAGRQVLKSRGKGLHSPFLESLPDDHLPEMGLRLVEELVRVAQGATGLVQLAE